MSNFELVMVGDMDEEEENFITGMDFPAVPDHCSEDHEELPLMPFEELDIKEEPLDDVDEFPVDISEAWTMSPSASDTEQTVGGDTSMEGPVVLFTDPVQENPRTNTKSMNVTQELQKSSPQENKLKFVHPQSESQTKKPSTVYETYMKKFPTGVEIQKPIKSVFNGTSLRGVKDSSYNTNVSQHSLLRASQSNSSGKRLSKCPVVPATKNTSNSIIKRIDVSEKTKRQYLVLKSKSNYVPKTLNFSKFSEEIGVSKSYKCKSTSVEFHCKLCGKNYENEQFLINHSCSNPNSKFPCKMCAKIFISSKTLQKHFLRTHMNIVDKKLEISPTIPLVRVEEWYTGKIYFPKPNLNCAVCKFTTESKQSLKCHIKSHFKIKYFKCKICNSQFLTRFNLKIHYKKIHRTQNNNFNTNKTSEKNNVNKLISCKKCNIQFKTKLELHIHSNSCETTKHNFDHDKICKKKYTCKICNINLNSRSKIDGHIFTAHHKHMITQNRIQNTNTNSDSESDEDLSLACKLCEFECTTNYDLQNHVKYHFIFKYKCKYCGIFLMNKSELEKHLKISHISDETTTLEIMVHTDENRQDIDNESTPTISKHDENITQYTCKNCGKNFSDSSTIKYHQELKHKVEWDAEAKHSQNSINSKGKENSKVETLKSQVSIVRRNRKQNVTAKKNINLEVVCLESDSKQIPDNLNVDSTSDDSESENCGFQFDDSILNTVALPGKPRLLNKGSMRSYVITCSICHKIYPTFNKLYNHSRKYHEITVKKLITRKTIGPLKCEVCSARFKLLSVLQHHMLRHRGILPYQCKFCGKLLGHLANVVAHHKNCNKNQNNSTGTQSSNEIIGKYKNNSQDIPFLCQQLHTCNICKIYFLSFNNLYEHAQTIHSNNFVDLHIRQGKGGEFKCDECSHSFPALHHLRQHKIRHRNIKAFPCMFCNNIYSSSYCAYHHCVNFHNSLWKLKLLKNKFSNKKCCDYMFEGSDYVSLTEVNSEKNMIFNCHKCNIIFKTKNEIYKHCKNIHGKSKCFCCGNCGLEFVVFEDLKMHIKSSACNNDTTTQLIVKAEKRKERSSEIEFDKTKNLELIASETHEGLENETNEKESLIKSKQVQKIKYAVKVEHEAIEDYLSGNDDSKDNNLNYSSESESSSHSKDLDKRRYKSNSVQSTDLVTSENHYVCNLCNTNFTSIDDVFKHGETSHEITLVEISKGKKSKDGPYKCTVCDHSYCSFNSLCFHMLLHRNIKPFSCKYCSKKFTIPSSLAYHYRVFHNEEEASHLAKKQQQTGDINKIQNYSTKNSEVSQKKNASETEVIVENGEHSVDKEPTNKNPWERHEEIVEHLSDETNTELFNYNCNSESTVNNCKDTVQEPILVNTLVPTIHYYACNLCNQKFDSITDVWKHGVEHEVTRKEIPKVKKINTGPYKCNDCENSYASQAAIFQHNLLHRNIKPFVCIYCEATFTNYSSVLYHCRKIHLLLYGKSTDVKLISNKKTNKFCNIDENKSNNNYVNTFSQTYSCNKCKIYYSELKYLSEHAQQYHSDNFIKLSLESTVEPYKCDECDQSFNKENHLSHHKLKHRDLTPLPCLFCSKFYSEYKFLYYHYKKCHVLEWKLHKMTKTVNMISKPLKINYKTFMFEGSKYITLTELNKKKLSFECHKCKLVFETRDEVHHHCKTKHSLLKEGNQCNQSLQVSFGHASRRQDHCCKYCGETFRSSRSLNVHYLKKHQSQRLEKSNTLQIENVILEFCCDICDCTFKSKLKLQKHQRILHGMRTTNTTHHQGPFYCDACSQEFIQYLALKKHITSFACKNENQPGSTEISIITGQKRKIFVESECTNSKQQKTSTSIGYQNIADATDLKIENPCQNVSLCTMQDPVPTANHGEEIITTIAESTDFELLMCQDCDTLFDSKSKLSTHMKRHIKYYYNRDENFLKKQDPEILKLNCTKCNKIFKTQYVLKSHICINQGKIYTCIVCKEKFVSKHLYFVHKSKHEKSFICEVCGDGFFTEYKLKMHTTRLHEEPKYLCYLCGSKFPFAWSLNIHLKRHKDVEYNCKECDEKFLTFKQRTQHNNIVHGGVTLFFCKFCSQSFNRKDHLNEHEQIHTKTKRTFKCEPCNKLFYSSTGIKSHNIRIHSQL